MTQHENFKKHCAKISITWFKSPYSKSIKMNIHQRHFRKRSFRTYSTKITYLFYNCCTITAQIRKRLEANEMCFLGRMMRMPWTEPISNDEVLEKKGNKRALVLNIENSRAIYKERRCGNFDTHRLYWRQ